MSKAKTIKIEPTLSKKSISTMSDVTDIIKSANSYRLNAKFL